MSSIFGIIRFDGTTVSERDAGAMRDALNHWRADREGMALQGRVMLGSLLLFNTPESLEERMPYETETCIVTADARLDNRDQLLPLLRSFPDVGPSAPDVVLIARAYEKFGQDCVHRLRGDFAFGIWDKKSQGFFAARDHLGVKPLFYYWRNGLFVFATEKKGILALDKVDASINIDYVYTLLSGFELQEGEDFHKHISILPAAHTVHVQESSIKSTRYWVLEPKPLLNLSSVDQYREALFEGLERSVRARLRTVFPVGAELSGGLDSSGVAALAARFMDDPSRLYTCSHVVRPDDEGRKPYEDEEDLIDEFTRYAGIQNPLKIFQSSWSYLQEPLDLALTVHDGPVLYNAFWQEPAREALEARGCRVVLSGFGGDEVVTNRGTFYYFELLEEGHWLEFTKAAWARKKYLLPFSALLRRSLPASLQSRINRDAHKNATPTNYLLDPAWEEARLRKYPPKLRIPSRSQKALYQRNIRNLYDSGRLLTETLFGLTHRMEPRYPLLDVGLLEFFMSLPAKVLGSRSMNRYLYRVAMNGVIPDAIRLRDIKSVAAGIFETVENRERTDALRAWFRSMEKQHHPGILDKIDYQKLIMGLDPDRTENQGIRGFQPVRAYRAELVMRYAEKMRQSGNSSGMF